VLWPSYRVGKALAKRPRRNLDAGVIHIPDVPVSCYAVGGLFISSAIDRSPSEKGTVLQHTGMTHDSTKRPDSATMGPFGLYACAWSIIRGPSAQRPWVSRMARVGFCTASTEKNSLQCLYLIVRYHSCIVDNKNLIFTRIRYQFVCRSKDHRLPANAPSHDLYMLMA